MLAQVTAFAAITAIGYWYQRGIDIAGTATASTTTTAFATCCCIIFSLVYNNCMSSLSSSWAYCLLLTAHSSLPYCPTHHLLTTVLNLLTASLLILAYPHCSLFSLSSNIIVVLFILPHCSLSYYLPYSISLLKRKSTMVLRLPHCYSHSHSFHFNSLGLTVVYG